MITSQLTSTKIKTERTLSTDQQFKRKISYLVTGFYALLNHSGSTQDSCETKTALTCSPWSWTAASHELAGNHQRTAAPTLFWALQLAHSPVPPCGCGGISSVPLCPSEINLSYSVPLCPSEINLSLISSTVPLWNKPFTDQFHCAPLK